MDCDLVNNTGKIYETDVLVAKRNVLAIAEKRLKYE